MANVLFTRTSDPSSKPITDGQLIFDTSGNGKMYLDVGDKRLEMGGAINIDSTLDPTSENPIQNKAVAGVMLSTLKEIDKVTSKGKLTDALATKELNTKVTDLETDISSLTDDYISKGKILGSLEEVTTATDSGFVPDALAIKELDTDLQGQINTLNTTVEGKQTALKTWTHTFTNVTLKAGTYVKLGTAPSGIRPANMISIFPYMFGNTSASVVVELENDGFIYAFSSDATSGNSSISVKIVYV